MLSGGSIVCGGSVRHSVLSRDVVVNESAVVEDSGVIRRCRRGSCARLRNCIVDKSVKIPPGEAIGYHAARDRQRFTVSDAGVVVIPKSYVFPPDSTDSPNQEEVFPGRFRPSGTGSAFALSFAGVLPPPIVDRDRLRIAKDGMIRISTGR